MPSLTVESHTLNVDILIGVALSLDGKGLARVVVAIEVDGNLAVEWRGDILLRIGSHATIHLEESHSTHNIPSSHLALVFIALPAVERCRAVVAVDDGK